MMTRQYPVFGRFISLQQIGATAALCTLVLGVNVLLFADLRRIAPSAAKEAAVPARQADLDRVQASQPPIASDTTPSVSFALDPTEELALALLGFGPREPIPLELTASAPKSQSPEPAARLRKRRPAKPTSARRAAPADGSTADEGGKDGWVIRR